MTVSAPRNLREYINHLRERGLVMDVQEPVSAHLELAEIHRRVAAANGPTLLFHNVVGSTFPVVTNLFGSSRHVDLAFGSEPMEFIEQMLHLLTQDFPPKLSTLWAKRKYLQRMLSLGTRSRSSAPVTECQQRKVDLEQLPLLQLWPDDGGHFVTLPLVYTEPIDKGPPNLGMYRLQRYDKETTGLHWQIAKGGGFHFHQAEQQDQPLPVSVFLGGPPALILSAIAPLPENVPEILLSSLLLGSKLATTRVKNHPHPLIAESEFALLGHAIPHERQPEGPFGDHYGYYSLKHPFPKFQCKRVYHRKDAIYPATIVGKPRQEDYYIGNYLQKLLSPLFPVVMPGVKNLWSYGETGFHSLSAAVVKERFYRESMASAFRILGEGQLSLTKFLLLTDQPVDLEDFPRVLETILERFRPETDLFIFANLSMDTLDYTGPELNKGSRGVLVGTGEPVRSLPSSFSGALPGPFSKAKVFCPGCLVLQGPSIDESTPFEELLKHESFKNWPLIILVDDVDTATKHVPAFLWTVFTRFEPAADIYAPRTKVIRHHLSYSIPLLIDARMKASYPKMVSCDASTAHLVTDKWHKYFPDGMEMGDSEWAHV